MSFIKCAQGTSLTFCSLSTLSDMLQSTYSLLLILAIDLSALRVSAIISYFKKPSLIRGKLITTGPLKQINVFLCQTFTFLLNKVVISLTFYKKVAIHL